ncbi:MAG: DUF3566 domain-containing protein [Nocardioidaceae bacterium]
MADRRADDTPLAPRRPLSGRPRADMAAGAEDPAGGTRPISERVSSAVAEAGTAVPSGASKSSPASDSASRASTPITPGRGGSTTSTTPKASPRPRGTRRARLRLVHLDPWSVMKTAFLLSIAFGIVTVVAVAVVMSVLSAAGVWDSINKTVADVIGGDTTQTFDIQNYVGTSRVLGFTMIVAVVDVVLITAISTLGAFLYNLAAALLGGVEVTLAEDER